MGEGEEKSGFVVLFATVLLLFFLYSALSMENLKSACYPIVYLANEFPHR